MAEHFCNEHQTAWFKRGKMKNFAHPIKDDNGEDTGEWCNEPKTEEEQPLKPKVADDMSKEDWAMKDKIERDSIEAQVAYKGLIELLVVGVVKSEDKFGVTALNYAMSKLGNWSSQGEVPKEESAEKMITNEQIELIKGASQKYKGYTEAYAKVLQDAYGLTNYKKLNTLQAEDLIKRLTEGEGLEKSDDLPSK